MLNDIKATFDERHEFGDDDLEVLKDRWPKVAFQNIPLAWIIPIDEMLSAMRYDNPIYEMRQEFGHLIVLSRPLKLNQKLIIQQAENLLKIQVK